MVTGGPGEGGAHVTRAVEEDLRRECASVTILRKLFHKKKKNNSVFRITTSRFLHQFAFFNHVGVFALRFPSFHFQDNFLIKSLFYSEHSSLKTKI